jgi:hypothetical protein
MVEMHLKNELVAHGKVDVLHQAILEMHRTERDVIDFRGREHAVLERAIDERNANKITRAKIAFIEHTTFKLLEVQVIAMVSDFGIMLLKKVGCHRP